MKTMRNIPVIIPYFTQEESLKIAECLKSGWVAQGPRVAEFEKAVAAYEGTGYGVATTSCTTALHLLMAALGLHEGQDVLVPSFTFVATANAVEYTGATAVLVDVMTDTYCLDVGFLERFIEENYCRRDGGMFNKCTGQPPFRRGCGQPVRHVRGYSGGQRLGAGVFDAGNRGQRLRARRVNRRGA